MSPFKSPPFESLGSRDAAVVLAISAARSLILTVAAARGAFRKKTDVQTLQIELLSAYGTLSALVGYVWKKGKENEDDDAPATPPSA